MYDKTSKISSGSAISKNVFTDISQFSNKTVKVKIRNTSGDFDISRFQQLLDKLEASKKRQQRQRSVEGRRDIFAQGLAGMMGNF